MSRKFKIQRIPTRRIVLSLQFATFEDEEWAGEFRRLAKTNRLTVSNLARQMFHHCLREIKEGKADTEELQEDVDQDDSACEAGGTGEAQ